MSVIIKTDKKQIEIKANDNESEELFNFLVVHALQVNDKASYHKQEKINPVEDMNVPGQNETAELEYNGFLIVKCKHCGRLKAFCSKEKMNKYVCSECNTVTEFTEHFRKLYLTCKCGRQFFYLTNIKDKNMFEINCLSCGAPAPIRYNSKKDIYETIK